MIWRWFWRRNRRRMAAERDYGEWVGWLRESRDAQWARLRVRAERWPSSPGYPKKPHGWNGGTT